MLKGLFSYMVNPNTIKKNSMDSLQFESKKKEGFVTYSVSQLYKIKSCDQKREV